MKSKLLAVTTLSILLMGCGISFEKPSINVEPIADITKLHNICVYQKSSGMTSYDEAGKVITDKLASLNITYKTTNEDDLTNCPYTLSYDIRRSINIPTYLSYMYVQVNDDKEYSLGSVQYSYFPDGGFLSLSSSSFINTDTEINTLLDQLLNIQSHTGE